MKKRILSIVLTICMVFMMMPVCASAMSIYVNLNIVGAADLKLEVESGDSIENVKEKIEAQTGYPKTDQILKYDYDHDYDDDVLENTRTLADYNIQKDGIIVLSLASAVTGTTSEGLSYTIYGGKVTITGYNDSRTAVTIPNTIADNPVTTIGELAFANCRYLGGITIPSSVTAIGNGAFDSCYELKSVTFGENSQLKSIGDYAFLKCGLTSINIPSSVTSIGTNAFNGCNFTSVIIPDSVTYIGRGAFRCGDLTSITVDPNNSNYSSADGVLFNKDKTELIHYPAGNTRTLYSIPSSVESVGNEAFWFCKKLKNVAFGADSKLQSIGEKAFQACENLESINIPNSVTSVGEDAFNSCTSLKNIIIPNNVTVINERIFSNCSNLESLFLSDKVSIFVAGAIPDTATQVKYSLDTNKGEVTITEINLGIDRTGVALPDTICGYDVVAISDASLLTKISSHTCAGGEATCQSEATCGICGKKYGEIDSTNHNLENIPAKDATVTETGNKEYWHCKDCGKYFSDENGKSEINDLAAWKAEEGKLAKLPPEIINGKGMSITAGETKELTFRSNADFSDFIRVELDGKTLDAKYYTAKEGSTIITLKADYVASLPAGDHTIGIVSTSGTATTEFTVNAQTVSGNGSPKTGDNSNLLLWLVLMILSASGTAGAVAYFRKNRTNK